jgi:hypothetical protein
MAADYIAVRILSHQYRITIDNGNPNTSPPTALSQNIGHICPSRLESVVPTFQVERSAL